MVKIGRISKIDLRDAWKHEAEDFSRWLAENIDVLSDALGIALEVPTTEAKVLDSLFSIDIVAEDHNGNAVVIENQLEKSDHKHLGQIITYVTNIEAKTAIWITKDPRPEHVNAINWLNQVTDKNFYLVALELIKIDDSRPAPSFNVICQPSSESKQIGDARVGMSQARMAREMRLQTADTIVVPARKDGFERVFIGENSWYAIRIRSDRIPQLKYIAVYQVAPISAITHLAEIKTIESVDQSGKYRVVFARPAEKIRPIHLGSRSKIQSPVYCAYERLRTAKDVDDLLLAPASNDDLTAA